MVGHLVPPRPAITYRRATSIGDLLVQSEFQGSTRGDPCKTLGTFQCGACTYCKYMNTNKDIFLPKCMSFFPKHYASCQTTGVVYLLLCSCNCFYVGKTTKKLWQRLYRHIKAMRDNGSTSWEACFTNS